MAINKTWAIAFILVSSAAWSRETASVANCQAAAAKPAIAGAKAAVDRAPSDLTANFGLADAWSDAGCYSDAVQVLQSAQATHPANKELETRLRVARSLIGEEHYFDTLDRADADAKLKRDTFRCSTLSDLEACSEAIRLKPDDPALLAAQADALRAKRSGVRPSSAANEEGAGQRVASAAAPGSGTSASVSPLNSTLPHVKPQKPIRVARVETSPITVPEHRFSNVPTDDRSH